MEKMILKKILVKHFHNCQEMYDIKYKIHNETQKKQNKTLT